MPPKTRRGKIIEASKENIGSDNKVKQKTSNKVSKPSRKALADKTNSASDDNASYLTSHANKKVIENEKKNLLVKQRPRRNRRLPTRYEECSVLQNLSNSNNVIDSDEPSQLISNKSDAVVVISPLKTNLDISLSARKSKRTKCQLPSECDIHSLSPTKGVPLQPVFSSTPKIQSKVTKTLQQKGQGKDVNPNHIDRSVKVMLTRINSKRIVQKDSGITKSDCPDTNNNAKQNHLSHKTTNNGTNTSLKVSLNSRSNTNRKLANNNFSFKVLEGKKKSLKRDASKLDVYEFTYDPNEEPPPQKKKRRRPAKKREQKPKTVIYKSNYDKNLAKALTALKNTVSLNTAKSITKVNTNVLATDHNIINVDTSNITSVPVITKPTSVNITILKESTCNPDKSQAFKHNYNSVRVEDIALDFELDNVDDINYSPINSPSHHMNPAPPDDIQNQDVPAHNNDPLNLRGDLSFFDDQPAASSSMNVSVRHPTASPWRADFGNLPIKWQVDTYVKPNMTPAFESSFINFNDSKKKHVYTDIGPATNETNDLPQLYEENTSKLKQSSIISFIKEVVEKSAKKRKEKMTPIKANSLFDELNNTSIVNNVPVIEKQTTPNKITQHNAMSNNDSTPPSQDNSNFTANENNSFVDNFVEHKKNSLKNSSKKRKDKDVTYFGFDDSESQDQENVSPIKKIDKHKLRALKPRSRAALQEINEQRGPTRAVCPAAMKSKPIQGSLTANKLLVPMKSATEPPTFPEKDAIKSTETINITEIETNHDSNDDDAQSVHLFEDVDVVHHLKAHRKSYGKTKKAVTFRQNSISDSDVVASDIVEKSISSDEDDLHDLTFKMPAVEPKKATKKKKKQKLSKKEEQAVEAWAAGFNSMCEDIEEFDLVVE